MNNFGKLVICKDYRQIDWFARAHPNQKTRVVVLDDTPINIEGYINASILLPLPSTLFRLIDYNDYNGFDYLYRDYLSSKEVRSFIYLLVMALYRGINIVLFCNTSDPDIFMNTLDSVLRNEIGVYSIRFEYLYQFPMYCSFNLIEFPNILMKLVEYGYMTMEEYNNTLPNINPNGVTKIIPKGAS